MNGAMSKRHSRSRKLQLLSLILLFGPLFLTHPTEAQTSLNQVPTPLRHDEPLDSVVADLQKYIPERMKDALRRVEGAFSVIAMTRTKLIGVRDPLGVRPLVLGKVGDDGFCLASET